MYNETVYSEEELCLYNPAFVGVLLYQATKEFCIVEEEGMHCALPFILVPMSLNTSINRSLPATYRTPIASWISSNEGLLSAFVPQSESYIPIVKAAISFLLDRRLLRLSESGNILMDQNTLPSNPSLFKQSEDMKRALKAAKYLGKWFAHAPSAETIYAQLGLIP